MDCAVGTVRQIHRQLIREGYCIGEYTLRKWIKNGSLCAVFTSNRAYISYAELAEKANISLRTAYAVIKGKAVSLSCCVSIRHGRAGSD